MEQYKTVFEVSYFSNGDLQTQVSALILGPLVLAITMWLKWPKLKARYEKVLFYLFPLFWGLFWFVGWGSFFFSALYYGHKFTTALKTGQCQSVEGVVKVARQGPKSDDIQIANEDFEINYYIGTLGYRQIIAQGGVLRNGVQVRIHYLGNTILKVEVKN
jgi:hypothetical protein